jgi:toxin ParE1/3/4
VVGFTLTARAEEDLIEIWTYIAADNPAAADRVLDRIEEVFGRVAANPQLGAARADLAEGLRYSVSGSYLVLYRQVGAAVEIVRVVHGERDLPSPFRDAAP